MERKVFAKVVARIVVMSLSLLRASSGRLMCLRREPSVVKGTNDGKGRTNFDFDAGGRSLESVAAGTS